MTLKSVQQHVFLNKFMKYSYFSFARNTKFANFGNDL